MHTIIVFSEQWLEDELGAELRVRPCAMGADLVFGHRAAWMSRLTDGHL
jgi:hypothetical protein